jgi:hypothetical protein
MEAVQTNVVPEQAAPLQLAKVEGDVGLAVRVTLVLTGKSNVHTVGQLMPAGLLVTIPLPAVVTVIFFVAPGEVKLAVTVMSAFIVTWQVAAPVQLPPLKLAEVAGAAGLAVRVTCVLIGKANVQTVGQFMPAGLLVTVPLPAVMLTVRFFVFTGEVKLAVTVWSVFIVNLQLDVVPKKAQAPPQLRKVEGDVAEAVSVTELLSAMLNRQVELQLMPNWEVVTVPLPVTFMVRVLKPGAGDPPAELTGTLTCLPAVKFTPRFAACRIVISAL